MPRSLLVDVLVLLLVSSVVVIAVGTAASPSPSRVGRREESLVGSRIQQRAGDGHWTVAGVDPVVDCPLKLFAAQFAAYLQPAGWSRASNWTVATFHALNLSAACNASLSDIQPPPFLRVSTLPASVTTRRRCWWSRFVDGINGSDTDDGSEARPWKSIQYALARSRGLGSAGRAGGQACIVVRAGVYYLGEEHVGMGQAYQSQRGVLSLTSIDSHLTITAFPGEEAVLSAGVPLDLQWSVYRTTAAGTIMQAKLPASVAVDWPHLNELFVDDWRAIRAKYPNGDPFTTSRVTDPTGYVDGAASWIGPDSSILPAMEVHVSQPVPDYAVYFPQFQIGVEGTVRDFDPPHSFWGLRYPPGGGGSTYVIPRGFQWNERFSPRAANWSNPTTGRIFSFHGAGWGSWQFAIDAVYPDNQTIVLGAGGWQEARGANNGGSMYVHNIFEELDDLREWFVDERSRTLYLMTDGDPPASVVASQVPCIVSVHGTPEVPVDSVTISGLTFAHTSNNFLRHYEAPSGGDYSVHRGGAVFLQGTQHVTIINNSFIHLGGNAVVVSNFNLHTALAWNEFEWLGESAMLLVGRSDGIDGVSNREQPTFTHIEGNLVHDFSVYVKQGDAIFEALSRSSIWAGNLAYNSPRSVFNKNDGFAGGLNAYQNLLFNADKETSDHGPINTWDRQPYMTEEAGNGPSLVPKTNWIHHNFIISDYGTNMAVDHDDGSAYYIDAYNFYMYSGNKNYLGHSKVNDHQMQVFPDLWGGYDFPGCDYDWTDQSRTGSAWTNGKCILRTKEQPWLINYCDARNVSGLPVHSGNQIFTPSGNATFQCGDQHLTLSQWQALGMDSGTTEEVTPSLERIIAWGQELLFNPFQLNDGDAALSAGLSEVAVQEA